MTDYPRRVVIEKWDCGNGHLHHSKDRAVVCATLSNRSDDDRRDAYQRMARKKEAYDLRQQGLTFKEIGLRISNGPISTKRATDLVREWERILYRFQSGRYDHFETDDHESDHQRAIRKMNHDAINKLLR